MTLFSEAEVVKLFVSPVVEANANVKKQLDAILLPCHYHNFLFMLNGL